MSVKLLNQEKESDMRMRDLADGQLAIIIDKGYTDVIVQRFGNNCIAIGKPTEYHWTEVHKNTLRVRVLKAGELIEVQFDNEEFI
jgi:hypothetical protein